MNQKKKTIAIVVESIGYAFVIIATIVAVALLSGLPGLGEDVLIYEMIRNITFLTIGLFCAIFFGIMFAIRKMRDVKEKIAMREAIKKREYKPENPADEFENSFNKAYVGTVLGLLVGIIFAVMSVPGISGCIKDQDAEIQVEVVNYTRMELNPALSLRPNTYVLYGDYYAEFNIGPGISQDIVNEMNAAHPKTAIFYYPNSRKVVQFQAYLPDGRVLVVPQGNEPISLEGETYEVAP